MFSSFSVEDIGSEPQHPSERLAAKLVGQSQTGMHAPHAFVACAVLCSMIEVHSVSVEGIGLEPGLSKRLTAKPVGQSQ